MVKKLLDDAAQNQALEKTEGQASSVRAAAANFQVELSEFRTDKQDPSSSKVFCTATVSYRLDPNLLLALEASARSTSVGSLDRLASAHGFERNANVFVQQNFKYSLQPTDDGSMVFAESSDAQSASMLSDLILMDVVRDSSASQNHVNVATELARLQAERARVTAAASEWAAAQEKLAEQTRIAQQPSAPPASKTPQTSENFAPGFDCRQAALVAERLICSDPFLSSMDVRLNGLYKTALSYGNASHLNAYQAQWLNNRRNEETRTF